MSTNDQVRSITRHGISLSSYLARHRRQQGRCAVCQTQGHRLEIDHDHSCCDGQYGCHRCVRGLLCGRCNRVLGSFKDDPGLLLGAHAYLVAT